MSRRYAYATDRQQSVQSMFQILIRGDHNWDTLPSQRGTALFMLKRTAQLS